MKFYVILVLCQYMFSKLAAYDLY